MRVHKIVYTVFVASILFDLATSILCFQLSGVAETNLLYRMVGAWAFPIVYLIDAGIIIFVEWLRRYLRWSPLILLVPILAYVGAGLTNLQLVGGKGSYHSNHTGLFLLEGRKQVEQIEMGSRLKLSSRLHCPPQSTLRETCR